MERKKNFFGTDGIRGRVGDHPINAEFVLKLGWAAGSVLANKGRYAKALIGKDTRISGYMFESALEAGLVAAGINIYLLGPMPTPAIAYLTRTLRADLGIVISASHNGFEDNGIKFFSIDGMKLDDAIEAKIEEQLQKPMTTVNSKFLGRAKRLVDAPGRYIEFCKSTFPNHFNLNHLKIVVDCGHGATYHTAPHVFRELGANIIEIASKPDGFNINEQCGSTKPKLLQQTVLAEQADLGIAFDGDGDRVIMIDHKGEIVDGDELLYIIAKRKLMTHEQSGIVGTKMSNFGLEISIKKLGRDFVRTDIGDRYVLAELLKRRWLWGGESSGHIICLDMTTTGDGIISALQVLAATLHEEKTLHELKNEMEKFPQTLLNVPVTNQQKILQHPSFQTLIRDAEKNIGQQGRILIRPSGTEPVIRVMVEGKNSNEVQRLAEQLAQSIKDLGV